MIRSDKENRKGMDSEDRNGMVSDSVSCPICQRTHPVRYTKKRQPFFTCDTIGYGTNIFPRSSWGKEKFQEWKQNAEISVTDSDMESAEGEEPAKPRLTILEILNGKEE